MNSKYIILLLAIIISCTGETEYHTMVETAPYWESTKPLNFVVPVENVNQRYNLYFDVRYNEDYQWSRFFTLYQIRDSVGHSLDSILLEYYFFDPVTGKPLGKSGIGDLYEKEYLIRRNFQFPYPGKFFVNLRQMMRVDSLQGVRSAGIRFERSEIATEQKSIN
jgi:gliding motility-associated lipoprotein GldH